MNKIHIVKAISAAYTFGRMDNALASLPGAPNLTAIKAGHEWTKLARAVAMAKEAEAMKRDALEIIASELLEDWTETDILAAMNGARADAAPGQDESHEIEAAAKRLAYDISHGQEKSGAIAREMSATRFSSPAWVKVLAQVERLTAVPVRKLSFKRERDDVGGGFGRSDY